MRDKSHDAGHQWQIHCPHQEISSHPVSPSHLEVQPHRPLIVILVQRSEWDADWWCSTTTTLIFQNRKSISCWQNRLLLIKKLNPSFIICLALYFISSVLSWHEAIFWLKISIVVAFTQRSGVRYSEHGQKKKYQHELCVLLCAS